ncbi:seryl-tRNA synthetase, partial [Cladochytrium tenue]
MEDSESPRRVGDLYEQYVELDFKLSEARNRRNTIAAEMASIVKDISTGKKTPGSNASALLDEKIKRRQELVELGRSVKECVSGLEASLATLTDQLYEEARHIPNISASDVPVGDESKAEVVEMVGHVPKLEAYDHVTLCQMHGIADFDRASK